MIDEVPQFDLGDAPRAIEKFRDFAGNLADPTAVVVKIKKGDGTVLPVKTFGTDTDVVKDAIGTYHIDIDANVAGTWTVRFEGSGVIKAATERRFKVRKSDFS